MAQKRIIQMIFGSAHSKPIADKFNPFSQWLCPKVESEILQDGNSDWKSWLKGTLKKGEDILDRLIAIFDETDIRPEVKDELWNAIGINVEINFPTHLSLPQSLTTPYYHSSLIRKIP
jgi:hypothetical protein